MSSPFDEKFDNPSERAAHSSDNPEEAQAAQSGEASGEAQQPIGDKYAVLHTLTPDHLGVRMEARDVTTQQTVLLRACPLDNHDGVALFKASVDVHRQLGKHPNIVGLLDAVADATQQYLVYPKMAGETLAEWLDYNAQAAVGNAWEQGLEYVTHCLDALGRIHAQGYQHGDVTPETMAIVSSESGTPEVKLLDVGLYVASDKPLCDSAKSMPYRAPEQIMTEDKAALTRATDIYGVGAILYTLFCGTAPESDATQKDAAVAGHGFEHFKSTGNATLDNHLQRIIRCAMAFQPEERFTSIRTMADALRSALAEYNAAGAPKAVSSDAPSEAPPSLHAYTEQQNAGTQASAAAVASAASSAKEGAVSQPPPQNAKPSQSNQNTLIILLLALIPLGLLVLVAIAGVLIIQPWKFFGQPVDTDDVAADMVYEDEEDHYDEAFYEEDDYDDPFDDWESIDPDERERLMPPAPIELDMEGEEIIDDATVMDEAPYVDEYDGDEAPDTFEDSVAPVPVPTPMEEATPSETDPQPAPQVDLTPISPPMDPVAPETPAPPPPQSTPPQTAPRDQMPERQVLPEGQLGEARPPQEAPAEPRSNFGWGEDAAGDGWEVIQEESRRVE